MANLYATMSRRTVTATVTGLSEEHEAGRVFRWYLDGALKVTETVTDEITSRSCSLTSALYAPTHTVKVTVSSVVTDAVFATLTATVVDSLALWSWDASNGGATAAQTSAAYEAAASQGLTADFAYLVWNDLVNTADDVLTARGELWRSSYATLAETLMEAAGDPLTDERFNALVQNLQYQYPFWRNQPGRTGYLGRLAVTGQEAVGASADIVYGAYLLELAFILNVLIDALGEMDAGYATRLEHSSEGAVWTSERLPLRAPASRRMTLDDALSLGARSHRMTAPPSRPMARADAIWSDASHKLRAPESRPLPITNRVRSYRSIDFIAQNERPLNLTHLLETARSILLSPDASAIMALAWTLTSVSGGTLTPVNSLALAASCASLTSAEGTVLAPTPATDLVASERALSAIAAVLATDEESVLSLAAGSRSGGEIVLAPDPSGILAITWSAAVALTQSIRLIANRDAQLAHAAYLNEMVKASAQLDALAAAWMAHEGTAQLGGLFNAKMLSPKSARLAHAVTASLIGTFRAALTDPPSVHLAYSAAEAIRATFFAALRTPRAVRMACGSSETLIATFAALLTPADAVAMTARFEETLATRGGEALAAAQSVHMGAELTETIIRSSAAALVPIPSEPLAADITEKLNDVCDAVLTPTDAEPLAVADGARSALEGILSPLPSAAMAHEAAEPVDGAAEMRSPDAADGGVVSVVITVLSAALEARPTVEPTTDWATQDGTNLDIRRTYYNRADEADSSVLLIDQAWYQEPVLAGTNLAITSEGYNDYGLGVENEDEI